LALGGPKHDGSIPKGTPPIFLPELEYEIWLKSAGFTNRLTLAFYDFFARSGAIGKCCTKL